MPTKDIFKDVKYLNKDFVSTRNTLIEFSKIYFPEEYNDFSDSSVGMMFIEMSAYVADVLSLYTDTQLRESLIQFAKNKSNIFNIAQSFSYQPKLAGVSYTDLDIYQIVPAITTGVDFLPNWNYALKIKNMRVASQTNPDIQFRIDSPVDFAESGSEPTDITIYELDGSNVAYYLLKKTIKASSGIVTTKTFTIGNAKKYLNIALPDTDIVDILNVVDSDGNTWYEVPYLAQDTVIESIPTEQISQYSDYRYTVPYVLRYRKAPRRFIKRVRTDNRTELQFGAGVSAIADELLIPNPRTIGYTYFNRPVDPRNFLNTRTYGLAPSNITLTVTYVRGTDERANAAVGDVSVVINAEITNDSTGLADYSRVKASLAAVNSVPATGAKGAESLDEIRNNTMAFFAAQERCVTIEDYRIRIMSMHPRYGTVAKVDIIQDRVKSSGKDAPKGYVENFLALNAYCLSYDGDKHLITLNQAVKDNLKVYLEQYRIATDAVNIKDAYIINIGVEFEIITYQNVKNKRAVVLRCIDALKTYFNIDNWQIGQPILITDLYNLLDKIEGVRTVSDIKIINKYDSTGVQYSSNVYDTYAATYEGVVYTSLDPSCFEVKYPDKDIFGRAK